MESERIMARDIIVVGGGVSGLSSAARLLEAGHRVRVWARDLGLRTTSSIAAAVWYPYRAFPEQLVLGWGAATYAEFVRLLGQPGCGVLMRAGVELFREPAPDPWWRAAVPDFRRAGPGDLPPGFADAYLFSAPVIEMPVYLSFLTARVAGLGGTIEQRAVASLDEVLSEAELAVNCVGLAARELVGDRSMVPIRGQVVRVEQVGLERFVLDDYGPGGVTYIVPRSHDCILGGTDQEHDEHLEPDPATAQAILERCVALEPRLAGARVLEHRVGLRPGRPTVRLEVERWPTGQLVGLNYGHGGAGVTLSWGCADVVAQLVAQA
jgi:D-amino-acid oxidase